jgi:hypothetical protein
MPRFRRRAIRAGTAFACLGFTGCALVAPVDSLTGGGDDVDADMGAGDDAAQYGGPDSTSDAPSWWIGDTSIPPRNDASPVRDGAVVAEGSGGVDAGSGVDGSPSGADSASGVDVSTVDVTTLDVAMNDEPTPPPPAIAFVQVGVATNPNTASSLSVAYAQAQGHGNLNVVAIGWNDATSSVTSVRDSSGNTYVLAVGPTRYAPDLSQSIYYAANIRAAGAGANTVTVAFDAQASAPDLRILEYAGLSTTSPLDVVSSDNGVGSGDVSSGGEVTSSDRELIVGAGMTTDVYATAGASFDQRAITNLGDIVEDRIVQSAGSYAADAPLQTSAEYVMQMAAFR